MKFQLHLFKIDDIPGGESLRKRPKQRLLPADSSPGPAPAKGIGPESHSLYTVHFYLPSTGSGLSTIPMPSMPKWSASILAILEERKADWVDSRWIFFTPQNTAGAAGPVWNPCPAAYRRRRAGYTQCSQRTPGTGGKLSAFSINCIHLSGSSEMSGVKIRDKLDFLGIPY